MLASVLKSDLFQRFQFLYVQGSVALKGIYGSFYALWLCAMRTGLSEPLWVVCATVKDAEQLVSDMRVLDGSGRVCYYPPLGLDFDCLVSAERAHTYLSLKGSDPAVLIVTTIKAMLGSCAARLAFPGGLELVRGQSYLRKDLLAALVDLGYERVPMVDVPGDFAVRGSIMDVYDLSLSPDYPLRLEFEGDELVAIQRFDLQSQRLCLTENKDLSSVLIWPCLERTVTKSLLKARVEEWCLPAHGVWLKEPALLRQEWSAEDDKVYRDLEPWLREWGITRVVVSFVVPQEFDWDLRSCSLSVQSMAVLERDPGKMRRDLQTFQELGYRVYWAYASDKDYDRLQRYWSKYGMQDLIAWPQVWQGSFSTGFVCDACALVLVTAQDVFASDRKDVVHKPVAHLSVPMSSFLDLKEGDYVIHLSHGIGIYRGLKRLEQDGSVRDYLVLEYKDEDLLYVPVEQIDLVQKYIGLEKARPRLHKLGGRRWAMEKKNSEEAIHDMASDMLRLQAKRSLKEGFVYGPETEMELDFSESFPFEETVDQKRAIDEVIADMCSPKPMDRLICGDVGYGKTEVALRAIFKAVVHGKQVLVLVPTTVLAYQHYHNFEKRLKNFPVTVEMLSRFKTAAEQKDIVQRANAAQVDIVVGTHRLLRDDVQLPHLGLVVIDEEQRFGVRHKEKLKHMRALVDVLTMSATPIPRTLYLSLTGMRDMSLIQTPPRERQAVHTEVSAFDEALIVMAMERELKRGGQVFFIHNRVQTIHSMAEQLQKLVPTARLRVGHGQMPEKQLEKTILDFVEHRFDVLVCTTIVESGVDIPNANTIFVNMADRFGLADMYQLRGRVGRFNRQAYAYFLIDPRKPLAPDAQKRLQSIQEYKGLGAGYRIAMRDLELRGSGNILGKQQHGMIARIGFDLYCSLLRKHIKQLKGEAPDVIPSVVDLKVDVTIPMDYVPDMPQRLEVIRRLAKTASEQELEEVRLWVCDQYGRPMPDCLELLFDVSKLKIVAGMKGYRHIGRRGVLLDLVGEQGHRVERLPKADLTDRALLDIVWTLL